MSEQASSESRIRVQCPQCGKLAMAAAEHVGRSVRCQDCQAPFKVRPLQEHALESPHAESPGYVGVSCHLCSTRMYVAPQHVGRKVKCPDCGALTEIRPPEKPIAKKPPAALGGEQYEVWDGDNQPWGSELLAKQPKFVPVTCGLCQTLMYAAPAQAGTAIDCPDCGAKTSVPDADLGAARKRPRPVSDGDEYELDASPPPTLPKVDYSSGSPGGSSGADPTADTRGARLAEAPAERARLPKWPLVTGVLTFWQDQVWGRWLGLSTALAMPLVLLVTSLGYMGGIGGGMMAQGMGVVLGVCLLAGGAMFGAFFLCLLASSALVIVTESSDGIDHITGWAPPNPVEWIPETIYLIVAGFVAAVPGYVIGEFAPDGWMAPLMAASIALCLPITLLSQLDLDSPWGVLSPHLVASLLKQPLSVAFFYVEVALLAAVGLGGFALGLVSPTLGVLLGTPIAIAAVLVYFRLIGRIAWLVAERNRADA